MSIYYETDWILPLFILIGLFLFAFVFWRDSTKEGFSSDKVLDTYILTVIFGFLGGKFLFREIDYSYLRYELATSPFILEGFLTGAFIAVYLQTRRNGWEGAKIGDMVAPGLSLFQAVLFLGVYLTDLNKQNLVIFILFTVLYFFIRFLKLKVNLGRSAYFFERIMLNKFVFTGGLLSAYLIFSGLIAISFLLYNINSVYWFWWFQLVFYLVGFSLSVIFVKNQVNRQFYIMDIKHYLSDRLNFINYLKLKKKQLKKDQAVLKNEDPMMVSNNASTGQQNAELGDDVLVKSLHDEINRSQQIVNEEKQEIDETINRLKEGTYGVCQKCGKKIAEDRLKAYQYAKYCITCQTELDEKLP